jgi:hypothetical protein
MNEERKSARSKADFIRSSGIGPELAMFVTEFVENPEAFRSISFDKRREIENQMDAILSSFGRRFWCPTFKRRSKMNAVKIAAIVLMLAGVLGLAYGSFSYTKETHETKIGPIELSVKDKQTVNVPVWAGVGAIVIGGVLLVFGGKKS